MLKSKSTLSVRLISFLLAFLFIASVFCMSASAAQTISCTLYKDQNTAYSNPIGLGEQGKIVSLKTYSDSNDGINMYLDYSIPGQGGWHQIQHAFAEPGDTAPEKSYSSLSTPASWRCSLTSWWWNGTGCHGKGTIRCE